ncbi:hypothetical protein F5Y12DRAFT_129107 [Xylaria sp. FL1777]|nr:hypothetical protein F5Y12DRAFT_129107 [Xylaria sp. FL1777]
MAGQAMGYKSLGAPKPPRYFVKQRLSAPTPVSACSKYIHSTNRSSSEFVRVILLTAIGGILIGPDHSKVLPGDSLGIIIGCGEDKPRRSTKIKTRLGLQLAPCIVYGGRAARGWDKIRPSASSGVVPFTISPVRVYVLFWCFCQSTLANTSLCSISLSNRDHAESTTSSNPFRMIDEKSLPRQSSMGSIMCRITDIHGLVQNAHLEGDQTFTLPSGFLSITLYIKRIYIRTHLL